MYQGAKVTTVRTVKIASIEIEAVRVSLKGTKLLRCGRRKEGYTK